MNCAHSSIHPSQSDDRNMNDEMTTSTLALVGKPYFIAPIASSPLSPLIDPVFFFCSPEVSSIAVPAVLRSKHPCSSMALIRPGATIYYTALGMRNLSGDEPNLKVSSRHYTDCGERQKNNIFLSIHHSWDSLHVAMRTRCVIKVESHADYSTHSFELHHSYETWDLMCISIAVFF